MPELIRAGLKIYREIRTAASDVIEEISHSIDAPVPHSDAEARMDRAEDPAPPPDTPLDQGEPPTAPSRNQSAALAPEQPSTAGQDRS